MAQQIRITSNPLPRPGVTAVIVEDIFADNGIGDPNVLRHLVALDAVRANIAPARNAFDPENGWMAEDEF